MMRVVSMYSGILDDMHYGTVIIALVDIVFTVIAIGLLLQLNVRMIMGIVYKKHAPFVSIPKEALELLDDIEGISDGKVVYDLGCGNGKVLMYMADRFPGPRYIGIEYDVVPYVIARINTRRYRDITIRLGNLFKEDLSDADVIIMYLYPGLMEALLGKLRQELKSGTLLYSFDFAFAKMEPEYMEYGNRKSAARGKRLLKFRF